MFTDKQVQDATTLRHTLHQHSELKYQETQTAKRVAERLRTLGYRITEGIAITGVLAELDTRRPGDHISR